MRLDAMVDVVTFGELLIDFVSAELGLLLMKPLLLRRPLAVHWPTSLWDWPS